MSDISNVLAGMRTLVFGWTTAHQVVEQEATQLKENEQGPQPEKDLLSADKHKKSILVFSLSLFLFVIVTNAWISDDAYITLRTVYNFIHGYGPTWNVDERVQTFTHPLWMLLLSGTSFFVRDIYFSTLFLSIFASFLVAALLVFRLVENPLHAVIGLTILAASKSYVDYSTSGLENPLTHLLMVLFVLVFLEYCHHKRSLFGLSFLAALMMTNRMDTALLCLPALLYAWYTSPRSKWKGLQTMLLASFPFVTWELFSLFYYGFLFPNTAYAKLSTGIATTELIKQGVSYLISSFTFDPLLFLVLVSSMLLVWTMKDWKSLPLLAGVVLYLLYIVKVGGDFMAGRFLTPPFLMTVILLLRNIPLSFKGMLLLIFVIVLLLGFLVPNSRWYAFYTNPVLIDARGVSDEHLFYRNATGLVSYRRDTIWPNAGWSTLGFKARLEHQKVVVCGSAGFLGYWAGPGVHVIDYYALTDPLLARLPMKHDQWRIGHFVRDLPAGYLQTLETGTNLIQDPDLARYYDKLHLIVSGPLFDVQRLIEIWKLNMGSYDHLLSHYNHRGSHSSSLSPLIHLFTRITLKMLPQKLVLW